MKTYVVLIRGINVGGRNVLLMKELAALLDDLGCEHIKTYIQSGNVVLQNKNMNAAQLSTIIPLEVKKRRGFEPNVLILERKELEHIAEKNPFPEAESDPKSLHVGFLDSIPGFPDLEKLESLRAESERFHLSERAFYLHEPNGVGRSKLAANTEKLLGVSMTSRNWRTVARIVSMLSP